MLGSAVKGFQNKWIILDYPGGPDKIEGVLIRGR